MSGREGAFGFQAGEPETLESLTQRARWTRDALDRAAGEQPAPPPENESSIERFKREMRERAERERRDEGLARRVENLHPDAPLERDRADPLRAIAREQRPRRRRRRGVVP